MSKDKVVTEESGVIPAFAADCHLGKLAKYLRMMGFDTLYFTHIEDNDLVSLASAQNRIILTCDRGLSERKSDAKLFFFNTMDTKQQLRSLIRAFHLEKYHAPFSRCIVCNTPLQVVEKENVVDRLPEKVKLHFFYFEYCPLCDRLYWHGDHYRHMQEFLQSVMPR